MRAQMKILQVNAVASGGSTAKLCGDLSWGLRKRGHECQLAYSWGSGGTEDFQFGDTLSRNAHAVTTRVRGLQGYGSKRPTRELLEFIGRERFDVVNLHNLHSNNVHLPLLLSFLAERDITTVLTLHDVWFYTGNCTHYSNVNCQRWTQSCGDCPLLRTGNASWLVDRTTEMLNDKKRLFASIPRLGVIGVSDWIASEASRSILRDIAPITRVYNWVDTSQFVPTVATSRTNAGEHLNVVAVATRWTEGKGLAKLLQLATRMMDEGLGTLTLVGELPSRGALPENVHALGPVVDPARLVEIYNEADVFVSASTEESFGLVVAEALSCGTPVIVMAATGSAELVDQDTGILVNPDEEDGLINAVRTLSSEPPGARRSACRARAVKLFSRERGVESYERFYRDLMARTA